jgi:hypothetical protein
VIVCLGWGSLIWKPGDLALKEPVIWHEDGPSLPVEFARKSQNNLMTLVLMEGGPPVTLLWAEMAVHDVDAARRSLMKRERVSRIESIGCWPCTEPFLYADRIGEWARSKSITGVVWTALPPRFETSEDVASVEAIIAHLRGLDAKTKDKAEEYVRKAPVQIRTPHRSVIERELGWNPIDVRDAEGGLCE